MLVTRLEVTCRGSEGLEICTGTWCTHYSDGLLKAAPENTKAERHTRQPAFIVCLGRCGTGLAACRVRARDRSGTRSL